MKQQKKYKAGLRACWAITSIMALCTACLVSCGIVVLGTVFLYNGEITVPVMVVLCLLVCTLTMVLGGIFLYSETSHLVKPVEEINRVVNRITEGDFSAQIPRRQKPAKNAVYWNELDELETNVNRMASELAGMDFMRKDFVSNVSHELKTPVASMMGFAQILLESDVPPTEQREYVSLIYDESQRVSRLCENMLRMSRLNNQALVIRREPVMVDEQIRKCVILLSEKWEDKGLEFDLELPRMWLESDPDMLQQIWLNLIDNAMKYSAAGTVIHISGQVDDQGISVSVRDEGIGIPPEKQGRIFDAFYQCEESHKKDGNGLGLSIVKRILELLDGSIECRSKEGSGTEMLVSIGKN